MNRNQQLEAIRATCIKANPEINELCTNCQERLEGGKHKYGPTRIGNVGCASKHIHGRPIRLADVLLAIDGKARVSGSGNDVRIEGYGGDNHLYYERWDCRQDDLTEQNDECLEFLAELLK